MLTKVTHLGRGQSPQPSFIKGAKGGFLNGEISQMLLIVRKSYHLRHSSDQGFTLLETLVAILVITVVGAAIAPPILLSAATRLQNQRVEQATQLARGEMDRIKLLVERGDYQTANLPPSSGSNPIQNTPAPAAISNLNSNNLNNPTTARTSPTQSFSVKFETDPRYPTNKPPEFFVVQTFRGQEQTVSSTITTPAAFMMGVRVYSGRSFANGARPTLTQPTKLGFTSGGSLQRPLAVLYTPIVRSDQSFSLCKYTKLLTPTANCQ